MPVYSFGVDSPLKFELPDKVADHYNKAVEQFIKAQVRFNQKFGREWDPDVDPVKLIWSNKQRRAWNQFAKIFTKAVKSYVEQHGGHYHPNDIMDDFLIRNAGSAVAVANAAWGRSITLAVGAGTLYGLLRGL